MEPEMEQLMTARHKAFVEWNAYTPAGESRVGLYEAFCAANRAYVQARGKAQAQIPPAANTKAA
jgi:hypothetical protein